jgi:hypothetical protein
MISFRFHLVSITAVFLAIALGVVIGSTFVDRAIVDGLEERIDTVSGNLDARREEIADLEEELASFEQYTEATQSFAVSGRLDGDALLVVAPRGVPEDAVRSLVELAGTAGATAPGVLWVEPRWTLDDDGAPAELAELADLDEAGSDDELRAVAWEAALDELVAPATGTGEGDIAGTGEGSAAEGTDEGGAAEGTEGADTGSPSDGTASTSTSVPVDPAVAGNLDALIEGGFLSFESVSDSSSLDSLIARSPVVAVVTGPEAEPPLVELMQPLVAGAVEAGLPTLVAEAYEPPPEDAVDAPRRGEAASAAVPEEATAGVTVVDHLDLPMGRVAAVLAAADLTRGVVGRYGLGDGASGIVPAWTPR